MIFAALIHWFVLAVFCWILAEYLQLYMCVHFGWNRSSSRLKYFAVLGWGAYLELFQAALQLILSSQLNIKVVPEPHLTSTTSIFDHYSFIQGGPCRAGVQYCFSRDKAENY